MKKNKFGFNFKKTEKFERIEDFMMFFDTVNYLPGDILVKVDSNYVKWELETILDQK